MRTVENTLYFAPRFFDELAELAVHLCERIAVEKAATQSRLIGGYDNAPTRHARLRDGSDTPWQRNPFLSGLNKIRRVMVNNSVTIEYQRVQSLGRQIGNISGAQEAAAQASEQCQTIVSHCRVVAHDKYVVEKGIDGLPQCSESG